MPNLNQELYFSWIPKLDAALTSNGFNGTVGTFFATFDKLALDNLEFCADLLSRLRPEKTIDTETLTKIAKQVEQLRRDAEAAKIDESLKSSILDDLDDIASAIEDYAFGGISSLERGVQRAFGSLVLKGDRAARLKENSVWKRFIQILSTLTLAISAANGALQLPHNVHQFLIQHGVVEEHLQLTYDPGQSPTSTEIHTEHEGTAPPSEHPDGNAQGNGAAHDTGLKNT